MRKKKTPLRSSPDNHGCSPSALCGTISLLILKMTMSRLPALSLLWLHILPSHSIPHNPAGAVGSLWEPFIQLCSARTAWAPVRLHQLELCEHLQCLTGQTPAPSHPSQALTSCRRCSFLSCAISRFLLVSASRRRCCSSRICFISATCEEGPVCHCPGHPPTQQTALHLPPEWETLLQCQDSSLP